MSLLQRRLFQKRRQHYLHTFIISIEHILEKKTHTEQITFITRFAYAIVQHHPDNEIIYVLSVQSTQHFLHSIQVILQYALLDILCLDICLGSVKC